MYISPPIYASEAGMVCLVWSPDHFQRVEVPQQRGRSLGLTMAEPCTIQIAETWNAATLLQASQPQWYAIQTRPRHEQAVATQLNREGIEVLLPTTAQTR